MQKSYELSPMQQGMLFHAIGEPGSGVDIEQIVCRLDEQLDTTAMLRAWDLIASRHTILRTAFVWEGIDEPIQQVYDSVRIPSEIIDWRGVDSADQASRWEQMLARDRKLGFDLSNPPLMRLHVVQLGECSWRLLWTFHHALLDGRSFPIVLREVFAAYTAFRDDVEGGPQLASRKPYYDYIEWLRTQDLAPGRTVLPGKTKRISRTHSDSNLCIRRWKQLGRGAMPAFARTYQQVERFRGCRRRYCQHSAPGSLGIALTSSQRRARHCFWRNPCRTRLHLG